jgi:cytochrome b6-f complex iron-sulfur subunit
MQEDHLTPEQASDNEGAPRFNRRSFLTWLARGSVAAAVTGVVAQAVRFLSFQPPSSESSIMPLGQPDSYPRNSLIYVAEARVYVGHDSDGLYALDAVCPHLGCLVQLDEEGGFKCPCHDSLFDEEGRALSGPATRPLQHLHLWFDPEQGQLLVDRSAQVEPAVRLTL